MPHGPNGPGGWQNYVDNFGKPWQAPTLIRAIYDTCYLCAMEVLHDRIRFDYHLRRRHAPIDLYEYFHRHVLPDVYEIYDFRDPICSCSASDEQIDE